MLGASEDAHVEAALGDQAAGGVDVDAGDGAEQLDELGVRLGRDRDASVEGGDRLVERVDVGLRRDRLRSLTALDALIAIMFPPIKISTCDLEFRRKRNRTQ